MIIIINGIIISSVTLVVPSKCKLPIWAGAYMRACVRVIITFEGITYYESCGHIIFNSWNDELFNYWSNDS